jgi:hypothetical protein
MRRRGKEVREERRTDKVEINLAADEEGGRRPSLGSRRGCAIPFTITVLALLTLVGAHLGPGFF